jgi:hypothetical protein
MTFRISSAPKQDGGRRPYYGSSNASIGGLTIVTIKPIAAFRLANNLRAGGAVDHPLFPPKLTPIRISRP